LTSVKEVMFYPAFVRLPVCLSVRLCVIYWIFGKIFAGDVSVDKQELIKIDFECLNVIHTWIQILEFCWRFLPHCKMDIFPHFGSYFWKTDGIFITTDVSLYKKLTTTFWQSSLLEHLAVCNLIWESISCCLQTFIYFLGEYVGGLDFGPFDMPVIFLSTRKAACFVISVNFVCMYVCLSVCRTITFKRLQVGSSYLHIHCISTQYESSLYMKVIGSRSQEQKRSTTSASVHVKNSIANNSASITHSAVKCACSIGCSPTADRMAWPPSFLRDRK